MIIEFISNVIKKTKIAKKIFSALNLSKIARMDLKHFTNKKVAKLKQKSSIIVLNFLKCSFLEKIKIIYFIISDL